LSKWLIKGFPQRTLVEHAFVHFTANIFTFIIKAPNQLTEKDSSNP
jgi:hypothetical protein